MIKIVIFVIATLFSSSILAHSGHDHGHWSSLALHLFTVGAVLSVVVAAIGVYKARSKAIK